MSGAVRAAIRIARGRSLRELRVPHAHLPNPRERARLLQRARVAEVPQLKSDLNELQAARIGEAGVSATRGAVRHAITILDETGASLEAPPPLWDALLARDWRRLFVELRPLWSEVRVTIFGHAMLEKLLHPRKDLTAHVWCGER